MWHVQRLFWSANGDGGVESCGALRVCVGLGGRFNWSGLDGREECGFFSFVQNWLVG
jgi:hypothetical protein